MRLTTTKNSLHACVTLLAYQVRTPTVLYVHELTIQLVFYLEKPILFTEDGYRLRCHQNGYKIKIFIVVTMYNEDDKELVRTLRGKIALSDTRFILFCVWRESLCLPDLLLRQEFARI